VIGRVVLDAEPEVRIHLPPADSPSLSRSAFEGREPGLSARLWAVGLALGSPETRRVLRDRTNRRHISVEPYSSTAVPLR